MTIQAALLISLAVLTTSYALYSFWNVVLYASTAMLRSAFSMRRAFAPAPAVDV